MEIRQESCPRISEAYADLIGDFYCRRKGWSPGNEFARAPSIALKLERLLALEPVHFGIDSPQGSYAVLMNQFHEIGRFGNQLVQEFIFNPE